MSVSEPPDVKELVALARRFAERRLYDEAAELFGVALRLEPRNLGTRLALARIRRLQKAQGRIASKDPIETAREELWCETVALPPVRHVEDRWVEQATGQPLEPVRITVDRGTRCG